MTGPRNVLISAVEPSGDSLGAALMSALSAKAPGVMFHGCGGPQMAAAGLASLFDINVFSVMGPVGALKALPAAMGGARQLAEKSAQESVDIAVLIDSWAFSRIAAEKIRKASPRTKIVKYVAPQVWASRPKRAQTAARLFDGMITLFDFERPYFEAKGVPTICAGHSGFQDLSRMKDGGPAFRIKHELGAGAVVILAPGSRRAEIRELSGRFRAAIDIVRRDHPELKILVLVANGRETEVHAVFADWNVNPVFVDETSKAAAFDAADAGLVASGTVSTELAIFGTPMVVGYRFDPVTAAWARSVVTAKWASLVNIASDAKIIPEFIQEDCTPSALAAALGSLLADEAARSRQIDRFPAALGRLGVIGPPAAEIAATAVLDWAGA